MCVKPKTRKHKGQAVSELRQAAPEWANRPLKERIRVLRRFGMECP